MKKGISEFSDDIHGPAQSGNRNPTWIIDKYGNAYFNGNVVIDGNLNISLDDIEVDDLTVNGTLTVDGASTLTGAVTAAAGVTLSTMTQNSVLFAGTSGLVSQNNTALAWNDNTRTFTVVGTAVVTGLITASTAISAGASPAAGGGFLRGPNNEYVRQRNAGNSADILVIGVDGSNIIEINGGSGDFDFRVQADGNTNAFMLDAGLFTGQGAFGFGAAASANQYILVTPPAGAAGLPAVHIQGRIQGQQGADVATAATVTLGDGNVFVMTGSTGVNLITTTGWTVGAVVWLKFTDALATITHNTTAAGLTATIITGSAGTWTGRANDMVTLVLTSNGAVPVWTLANTSPVT